MLAPLLSPQFWAFVVFQSLVGCIGDLGNSDQLGKNKPDDAKECHEHPSHHQVSPQEEDEEARHHQAVANEEDDEACLAPRVIHLPVLWTKVACSDEILLCLQSWRNSKCKHNILKMMTSHNILKCYGP